jgi:hypothetical protein|tara:strand:+ start:108 stop:437 length:330 start_codon:yes stop_codon:yes gene_type:complete
MDTRNQNLNHPLTVGQFQEHVETLTKVVATKFDVQESEDRVKQYMDQKMTEKFDKVMNSVDKMAKDVSAIRQEQSMKLGRDDRQDEGIKNVKTRVTVVEQRVGIKPIGT